MATSQTVSRRSVFLIGGYEPKSSTAFFTRTRRELARFCETWQISAEMEEPTVSEDGRIARARVQADVHGKHVTSDINFCVWNEIVLKDFAKSTLVRVVKYLSTFGDYVLTGTFMRITQQSWRFSLYFLYPALMLFGITLAACLLGALIARQSLPGAVWLGILTGLSVWCLLMRWTSRRLFLSHLMDLWSFSRSYLRGCRPDAEALIDGFAEAIVSQAKRGVDDEIILVGHSTGGALILHIAAAALEKFPELGQDTRLTVLTVGSTALKIGLHPAATAFRQHVQSLVDAPAIQWIECQAHTDIVNFYKTDPVAAMNLHSSRGEAFPQVHVVRIRDMLQPEIYKRFKFNIFRVHYQFIMANTKRYAYDFFMMCCGERIIADNLGDSLLYSPISKKVKPGRHV
jgi:pimeloyl-ACP methyl ester carboxylesterase